MAEETKREQDQTKINTEKQAKLKKQAELDTQDEKIKQEDPKALREKLSNKNSDYVFRIEKELQKQGSMSRADAVAMTNGLLSEIIIAQRHGQPANGLYLASPAIKAEQMLHPKKKPVATPTWQLMVDGSLLYSALFFAIFGVMASFESGKQAYNAQWGVLTLASIGILMGIVMVKYNDLLVPQAGKRPSWVKLILGGVVVVVIMLVVLTVLATPLLRPINPVLPGPIDVAIAVVVYGVRYLFRKHYNIVGSAFAPRPQQHK
ncbi:MAG: DUF1129 family protein [Lactobacillus crispatus]